MAKQSRQGYPTSKLLPFKKSGGPLLVVGPAADSVSWQMGGWTIGWQSTWMGL